MFLFKSNLKLLRIVMWHFFLKIILGVYSRECCSVSWFWPVVFIILFQMYNVQSIENEFVDVVDFVYSRECCSVSCFWPVVFVILFQMYNVQYFENKFVDFWIFCLFWPVIFIILFQMYIYWEWVCVGITTFRGFLRLLLFWLLSSNKHGKSKYLNSFVKERSSSELWYLS